ncbi:MAG: type II secretion system minor pseudopilin GspI [Syntrophales bacterium]|nr:type II secretion system minor pseudopilin GspI [Syntrophales bacterium]
MVVRTRTMRLACKQVSGGFTLLEVMVAMAILAISLTAVFQSHSQSISMTGRSRFETTAALLAQSLMAQIEATSPRGIIPEEGNFGDDFPDYTWSLGVSETEIENLRKIELTVTNSRMTLNNDYRLVLYRFITG